MTKDEALLKLDRAASNLKLDIISLQNKLLDVTLDDEEFDYYNYAINATEAELVEIRLEIEEIRQLSDDEWET